MKLSEIHLNPSNPRLIKDDRFKKLVKSISDFPKMMELRPIIVDSEMMILGGNMRFKVGRKLGKTHQNVLIFLKGDAKRAVKKLGSCEFGEIIEMNES